VVAPGSDRWSEYLLIRDYLRNSKVARLQWDADVAHGAPKAERSSELSRSSFPTTHFRRTSGGVETAAGSNG